MTKFKDVTKGGYKILWREEVKEGERKGWFVGEIRSDYDHHIIRAWTPEGETYNGIPEMDLVPAEPEITHSGWINVYEHVTSGSHDSIIEAKDADLLQVRIGLLRIDWYDNGTYTVTKEGV